MMDYTDRHYRMLMRLITKHTILYTEMVSTGAILYGERERHIGFSESEHPIVLQVGGDNHKELATCTRIAADYGYDEINLNTGCPSDKVQKGSFGAALMANPALVGEIVSSMCQTSAIPVSVKCRIGIDGSKLGMPTITDYASLKKFAQTVFESGAQRLSVHARIAILGGLSPKENREIPPLQYSLVYELCKELKKTFPHKIIEINGGITTSEEIQMHLNHVDGVMLGRVAVDNPMLFQDVDCKYGKSDLSQLSAKEVCLQYAEYIASVQDTLYTHYALRHIIPMFNGNRGARKWRQSLTLSLQKNISTLEAVQQAFKISGVGEDC